MARPTIDRRHGTTVLYDTESGYHVELSRADLARLVTEGTFWLYADIRCDGAVPIRDAEPMVG